MKKKIREKLIFVYNANSGTRNALFDSMHKILSPRTYQCSLCDLTYGVVSENRVWKKFRKQSDRKLVFLHKDEFAKKYASKFGYKFTFPIVLIENENELQLFIATEELNQLSTARQLITLVEKRLKKISSQ